MLQAISAKPINDFETREPRQPHLRLVASDGVLLETFTTPESASASDHESSRYKGHVLLERLQVETDAQTQLAEMVEGVMSTDFELRLEGDDLYDEHGRSMDQITQKSIERAERLAEANPNLQFELRRSKIERKEFEIMLAMAQGKGPNTMIVQSDLPPELQDAPEDVIGYNVTRKQAMERVLTRLPEGKIRLRQRSLDGSNRQGLEAIHEEFGEKLQPGETLGQRIQQDLTAEEQEDVMERITGVYDRTMSAQFGGEWYGGRRPVDYRNTYDFVCQQKDLVDIWVTADISGKLTNDLMYKVAAAMQKRFEKNKQLQSVPVGTRTLLDPTVVYVRSALRAPSIWREMETASYDARRSGKTFSGCGGTLKAEGDTISGDGINSTYGEIAGNTKSWHGGKKFYNTKCVSCKEVKSEVGACKICEDCVKHPKKGKIGTVQGRTKDPKTAKVNKEPAEVISLDRARKAKQDKKLAKANSRR